MYSEIRERADRIERREALATLAKQLREGGMFETARTLEILHHSVELGPVNGQLSNLLLRREKETLLEYVRTEGSGAAIAGFMEELQEAHPDIDISLPAAAKAEMVAIPTVPTETRLAFLERTLELNLNGQGELHPQ